MGLFKTIEKDVLHRTRTPVAAAAVLLLIGAFCSCFGFAGLFLQHFRLTTYVSVNVRMTESRVEEGSEDGSPTYNVHVMYCRKWGDAQLWSDRIFPLGFDGTGGNEAYSIVARYPAESDQSAWASPRDPSAMFLVARASDIPSMLALFGLPFLLGGCGVFLIRRRSDHPEFPSMQGTSTWIQLIPENAPADMLRKSLLFATALLATCALVIGIMVYDHGGRFEIVTEIESAIAALLAIIFLFRIIKWRRIHWAFPHPEIRIDRHPINSGDTIQVRVVTSAAPDVRITAASLELLAIATERTAKGGEVNYGATTKLCQPYALQGSSDEISLQIPTSASPSGPPPGKSYPFYEWFLRLRIKAEGVAEVKTMFPIKIEASVPPDRA